MRHIPLLILFYLWLVSGRSDPGDLLQHLPIIRWLTYLLIPILLLTSFFYIAARGTYKKTVIDTSVVILILLIALSTYVNNAPWSDFLYGIGVYLRYPLLYIIFCNIDYSTSKSPQFIRLFVILILVLLFEAIFNYFVFGMQQDGTFFTLGITWGTSNAGVFFATFLSLMAAHASLKTWRYYHSMLLILIIVSATIASIRTTLLFSFFIILIVYGVNKRWISTRTLTCMVIASSTIILLATTVNWHSVLSSYPLLAQFDPGYRLEYIRQVILRIPDSGNLLLGAGPRSMKPGLVGSAGALYQAFLESNKSIVDLGSNQYVKGLAELGIAGMLVYWYMLYRVLRTSYANWLMIRNSFVTPQWIKILNLSFFGLWGFYACFGLISNDLWRMDSSSLLFWYFAAVITVAHKKNIINGKIANQCIQQNSKPLAV